MKYIKTTLRIFLKSIVAIILIATMTIVITSVSLIYDFKKPEPFHGPDIFNPYKKFAKAYSNSDTTSANHLKKANFHVHTRVNGILNECEYWPNEVYGYLDRLGYDIITFSNHNELTTHPFDSTLQVNVYEHGYNLFKYHKLVFGSKEVNRFDHLLPILASQRQFQLDILSKTSDIIQYNHPLRTIGTSKGLMKKLNGYDIIELDCGKSTENEFWDWALSAGHYSFGLANDDLHYPDRTEKIARRCNFLCTPSARYEDIKSCLLDGCYYSMRIPDYGNGNWDIKIDKNLKLPYINDIGISDSTIYVSLSALADSIKIFGQDHTTLLTVAESRHASYTMKSDDPYARFTIYFHDGVVIYTNPFARYDARESDTPIKKQTHSVNISLTILFNIVLLMTIGLLLFIFYRAIIRDESRTSPKH